MATATTEHYRAYSPKPFTRAERTSTTILFGGLHWRIERVIQAVLEGTGDKAQILPVAAREDLLTGREVADIGPCCPTSVATGNLADTPVQQIVERSGTLFFSFQDLDSTKPAVSVKIRVETITHYLQRYAAGIIDRKLASAPPGCPPLV